MSSKRLRAGLVLLLPALLAGSLLSGASVAQEPPEYPTLELLVAPAESLLQEDTSELTLHAELRNTGSGETAAAHLSLFLDPVRSPAAEQLATGFPDTAVKLTSVQLEPLKEGETANIEHRVPLSELQRLLAPQNPAADTAQLFASGVYRVQAVFTPLSGSINRGADQMTLEAALPAPLTEPLPADEPEGSGDYLRATDAAHGRAHAAGEEADQPFAAITSFVYGNPTATTGVGGSPAADTAVDPATGAAVAATTSRSTTQLSVIVPLLLPEHIETLPTRAQLAELFAADATLPRLLDIATRTGATLAIDPRIIIGIRVHGTDAPNSASNFLASLLTTGLPHFLLPYADADLTAQHALNLPEPLAPSGATFMAETPADTGQQAGTARSDGAGGGAAAGTDTAPDSSTDAPGDGTPDAAATEDATAADTDVQTGDNGFAATETPENSTADRAQDPLAQLSSWQQSDPSTAWLTAGTATTVTAEHLAALGTQRLILADTDITAHSGGNLVSLSNTATASGEPLGAVVGSGALSTAVLQLATHPADSLDARAARASLKSQLAFGGARVLTLPRDFDSATLAANLLPELEQLGFVQFTPLSAQQPGTATLQPEIAPAISEVFAQNVQLLNIAVQRESSVTYGAVALVQPAQLHDYQRSRLLRLFATANTQAADFAARAQRFQQTDTELINGIKLLSPKQTHLFGGSAQLPVQVRNTLPFAAVVSLEAQPASAAIMVDTASFENLDLAAGATTTVLVPLSTRVSSGDAGLIVHLTDKSGEHNLSTATFPLQLSGAVETVGLSVLAALAVSLLAAGVFRSAKGRARRRTQRDDSAANPGNTVPSASVEVHED